MLPPGWCFTCGTVLNQWNDYYRIKNESNALTAFLQLGIYSTCCRKTMRTHIHNLEEILLNQRLDQLPITSEWRPEQFSRVDIGRSNVAIT